MVNTIFLLSFILLIKCLFYFDEMKVSIFVWLFRLRELLISFLDVRKSPVEITLWKLSKNNLDIHYPCNFLSFAGEQKDDRTNRFI
jgi:uncharacterized membrane protein